MLNLDELKKDHRTNYLVSILERLIKQETEVREMLAGDETLHEMATNELKSIQEERERVEKQIQEILEKDKREDEFLNEIVLELRAGAGGDEASLFAWELAHMYEKFAEMQNWQWKTNYESKSDLNGYKEASFEIKGKKNENVYKKMRYEQGVHRVQRIPATEKNGRVHTSTASVAILPIRKKVNLEINPADIEMEYSRSGGKGGQNVNKVSTKVELIFHIGNSTLFSDIEKILLAEKLEGKLDSEGNIHVVSQKDRSQLANKEDRKSVV